MFTVDRIENEIGVSELAQELGVKEETVGRWITEARQPGYCPKITPSRDYIFRISELLGCPAHQVGEAWNMRINTIILPSAIAPKPCQWCKNKRACKQVQKLGLPAPCENVGIDELKRIRIRGLSQAFFDRYKRRYYSDNGSV